MVKHIILPISLMTGAIIGAGMFALPYVFHEAGLGLSLFVLGILTVLVTIIHLLYVDIIVQTPGDHNFISYAKKYLGFTASQIAFFMSIIEMLIVLVIYLTLSGKFINTLIQSYGSLYPSPSLISVAVIMFWLAASIAIFWDLKEMSLIQFLITASMVIIVSFVLGFGVFKGGSDKLLLGFSHVNFNNLLMLIGPILFSLSGRVVIVEVVKYFSPKRPLLEIRKAVIWGTVIPAIVYGFFVLSVLALSNSVSSDAISGLIGALPPLLLMAFSVLGLLAIWTSYIAVGFDINNILKIDLKLSNFKSGLIIVILPALLYFSGLNNFIFLISLVGGFFLALESIFIVGMWRKLNSLNKKKRSELILYVVVFVLCITLIYEVWKLLTEFY